MLAHVPRLLDFVQGLQILLKPDGVVTIEVPHLLRLVAENQFDTIYHEHFSYFSLLVLDAALRPRATCASSTSRSSGRMAGRCASTSGTRDAAGSPTEAVADVLARERAAGLDGLDAYRRFAPQVVRTKCDVLAFFVEAARRGQDASSATARRPRATRS